ncbi:uncharacterized protein KQ657_000167 [Scheffersomyces spartinae]|uniref:BZIP domain-containing protein n=1 Tax=Scheffersomyces spartinae TaxID=45513 RepID=A0A9P8AK64_9ASCO|nr:uncharacterized protein KQ657_000167 [Scheffersomyces spartinae]KAG7196155.1 hypothetical protein KQ657_000167 [Scheffersomyces spartinae]
MTSFGEDPGEIDNAWPDVKMPIDVGHTKLSITGGIQEQAVPKMEGTSNEYDIYKSQSMELNYDNMMLFNQQRQLGEVVNHAQPLGMTPPSMIPGATHDGSMVYASVDRVAHEYSLKPEHFSAAQDSTYGQENSAVPRSDRPHSDGSSPLNRSYRTVASPISSTSTAENNFYSQQQKDSLGLTQGQKLQAANSATRAKTRKPTVEDPDAELLLTDDWDLTEEQLQRKKKAQNRAAQRAFRERKETKLKDLEARLMQSEEEKQKLLDQLDMVRQQNLSIQSENEVLRSQGTVSNTKFTFPESQQDFIETIMSGSKHVINPEFSKMTVYDNPDDPGAKLLAMTAVWDYIQLKAQQLDVDYQDVDVGEIIGQLRGNEKCYGYGPAYPLELVDQVVENTILESTAF